MQEVLNFKSQNILILSFLNFINSEYFNVFLSLAHFNSSFLLIKFNNSNFNLLQNLLKDGEIEYLENASNVNTKLQSIEFPKFVTINIPSFFTGKKQDEIKFLDILKVISSKNSVSVGIAYEDFTPNFAFKDLESRYNSCVIVNFEKEIDLNFEQMGVDFLFNYGINIDKNILSFILSHIKRDVISFSILMQVVKDFIETYKIKIRKHHLEEILYNYEQARN